MLDVGRLATLRAVLAHGSFSAAGQALGLTQPAVSRQITLLERQAGTRLVRRTRQGARPTEAGRLLAGHAEAILDRLALASEQPAELAGLRPGAGPAGGGLHPPFPRPRPPPPGAGGRGAPEEPRAGDAGARPRGGPAARLLPRGRGGGGAPPPL